MERNSSQPGNGAYWLNASGSFLTFDEWESRSQGARDGGDGWFSRDEEAVRADPSGGSADGPCDVALGALVVAVGKFSADGGVAELDEVGGVAAGAAGDGGVGGGHDSVTG